MKSASAPLVVLAAGGTGGHMFPAEALAIELMARGIRLALFTDSRGGAFGGDQGIVDVHRLKAGAMAGKNPFKRIGSLFRLAQGYFQARALLKQLAPAVVVGFGGYASVPTMLAAKHPSIRRRTLIHEQNAVLGRGNRLIAQHVDCIATAFENVEGIASSNLNKMVRVGMPVRPAFLESRTSPYPELVEDGSIEILVLGGSQGAQVFARVVPAAIARVSESLRLRIRVSQQCRREDLDTVRTMYERMGVEAQVTMFFRDVPDRLAASHLLIARSGASTVAEIAMVGRPSLLVPYPYAADDHQMANARALAEAGAARVFPQPTFTPDALAACLEEIFASPEELYQAVENAWMLGQPEATEQLADLVCELIDSGARSVKDAAV